MTEHQAIEFDFPSEHDLPFIVSPPDPPKGLVLYLHWFDEAPNANRTQFIDEAKDMSASGYASLLPQLSFPWKAPPAGSFADVERIERESTYLVDLVGEARRRLDVSHLSIVGHDFGAMHGSLIAADLDSKCNVFIAATPRWADWFLRFWPIEEDRYDYMRALARLDPISAVGDIESPTLYQFARSDFYIAPMTGLELFEAAREPKTMSAYDADHAMDNEAARSDRLNFLREHLNQ